MKAQYDEISPITKEKTVFVERIDENTNAKICIRSGYNTTTHYHKTNEKISEIEEQFPDLIRNSRFEDEFGFYWYLSSMNLGVAVLFPEPDEIDEYVWTVMPIKIVDSESESTVMNFEFDTENMVSFSKDNFEDAFSKLYEFYSNHI